MGSSPARALPQVVETKMTLTFLNRFRPRRAVPTMPVFEGLAQVRAYWEGLRKDASLPDRSKLDPRGLSGMLDRVFLAERIGRGLAQLRVAGSGLADFAGTDVRGLPLSCLFAAESRPRLSQSLELAFDAPAVVEIDLGSDRTGGGGVVARLVLLPLADAGGQKLVLGAVSFAHPGQAACKFQIRSVRDERLEVKPPARSVEAAIEPIRRYGHLALVHTSE
jgi:hypothetical protein